ncbi:MBOAT, membrane-bound O-acyltransferase family-domain-containing protein [Xylariaceae sp. FL0255]|nr:MBOAT, membrane-bound O-acyltransferase family-domain-containing protein [Xylariaceae sp. FL0255]
MGILSFFRSIYDLDTLDTRFTNSSSTPYKTVIDSRKDAAAASKERAAKWNSRGPRSRWNTPEFYLYIILVASTVPYMFYTAYDASRTTHPNYKNYERFLSPGWIPGRKIDVTDNQYGSFRRNLPYLFVLLKFHPALRKIYERVIYRANTGSSTSRPTPEEADQRLNQRMSFDFGFAIIYLLALHGVSAFKVMFILYLNYQIATTLPRKSVPVATWVFNVALLFANDICKGYRFRDIAWYVPSLGLADLVSFGAWLDSYGGLMSRWDILFNLTVLRLISFNLDYYWSLDRRNHSPIEKQLDPASLSERDRVTIPAQAKDFSFRNYVAYAIYAPLYLTGPIITFNDFISQSRYKSATVEISRTIRYGLRFALCLLAMEVILHYDYVQAIAKFSPRWSEYTASQLCLLSFFNLHLIWLKLLLPWRFFRFWSLVDGIDPPENIIRCVSNNWSTLAFWRSWHRSFYRWSLRYIYIPLGGSSFRDVRDAARSVVTYIVVFTFVAFWHDIQLNLLIWGWLIVFFMLPEMAAGSLFPARRWENKPTAYRMLCCAGAVLNIFMMITANLVGFAFGVDGLREVLKGIFNNFSGYVFLLGASTAIFMAVQIMFEIRESEIRRGINLKC